MTSEQIYDLVAYFMKEDAGLPYRYDELSFEQRTFVDALVENFESDADETISNLELTRHFLKMDKKWTRWTTQFRRGMNSFKIIEPPATSCVTSPRHFEPSKILLVDFGC